MKFIVSSTTTVVVIILVVAFMLAAREGEASPSKSQKKKSGKKSGSSSSKVKLCKGGDKPSLAVVTTDFLPTPDEQRRVAVAHLEEELHGKKRRLIAPTDPEPAPSPIGIVSSQKTEGTIDFYCDCQDYYINATVPDRTYDLKGLWSYYAVTVDDGSNDYSGRKLFLTDTTLMWTQTLQFTAVDDDNDDGDVTGKMDKISGELTAIGTIEYTPAGIAGGGQIILPIANCAYDLAGCVNGGQAIYITPDVGDKFVKWIIPFDQKCAHIVNEGLEPPFDFHPDSM